MTKKELMNRYQEVLNEKKEAFEAEKVEKSKKISKKEAEFYGECFLNLIMDTVANDEPVKIVDFGNFEKKETKGREGIIQVGEKKGQEFKSSDSWKVTFKAGKGFKNRVKGIFVEKNDEGGEE